MHLWTILLLAIFDEVASLSKVPAGGNGSFIVRKNPDVSKIRIMTVHGYQIYAEVTSLKLHGGAKVLMSDGQWGKTEEFSSNEDGRMVRSVRESSSEPTLVTLPLPWETETRKLFIYPLNFGDDDVMELNYISFLNEGCRIEELRTDSRQTSCNTHFPTPVATQCNVTRTCSGNYIQYNERARCIEREWRGDTSCMPIRDVINNKCMYQSDEIDDSCPYTPDEIITFYSSVDDVEFGEPGRSRRVQINCRLPCSNRHRRYCRYNVRGRVYAHCLLCRVKLRCDSRVAILGR